MRALGETLPQACGPNHTRIWIAAAFLTLSLVGTVHWGLRVRRGEGALDALVRWRPEGELTALALVAKATTSPALWNVSQIGRWIREHRIGKSLGLPGLQGTSAFPNASSLVDSDVVACLRTAFATGIPQDKKAFSQFGEDGIIEAVFNCIGVTSKSYVEFGVQTGEECSTRWLREHHGFTGLMMDGGHDNPGIGLHQEMIYAETISDLLHKYKVPFPSHDHMTVDIDLNTWSVAAAILKAGWRPRSLIMEFNRNFLPHQSFAVVYDKNGMWGPASYDCYFGGSALAFNRLAVHYGYQLVAADYWGVNLFFVHNSTLGKDKDKGGAEVQVHLNTPIQDHPLYQVYPLIHTPCQGRTWAEVPEGADFQGGWQPDSTHQLVMAHKDHSDEMTPRVMYGAIATTGTDDPADTECIRALDWIERRGGEHH